MKRPLAVTGFTMLFTLLVLSGSNDKAISAVLLAALIAFVVFMCIKKVRRDKPCLLRLSARRLPFCS